MEAAEGMRWRERQAWERTAQLTAWLLQAWCRDAPTAAQLLGDVVVTDPEAALDRLAGTAENPREVSLRALDAAYAQQPPRL